MRVLVVEDEVKMAALIRRVELAGSFATVARKGDTRAGAVLVKTIDRRANTADDNVECSHPALLDRIELRSKAQLVDEVDGGRMNGVATKIPEEVRVLLENDHVDAGAREEQTDHHPGWTTTRDHALGR